MGEAQDQVLGGALYLGQNSEVSCSLFANNTANELSLNTDSWGGAIYVSGFYRSLPDETKVKVSTEHILWMFCFRERLGRYDRPMHK